MIRPVLAIIGLILVVAGVVFYASIFTVHQTQQALILQFGNPIKMVPEAGLHFKMPFIQDIIPMNVQIQNRSAMLSRCKCACGCRFSLFDIPPQTPPQTPVRESGILDRALEWS